MRCTAAPPGGPARRPRRRLRSERRQSVIGPSKHLPFAAVEVSGHDPTLLSVDRMDAAAFTKPWLEQYMAICGTSSCRSPA